MTTKRFAAFHLSSLSALAREYHLKSVEVIGARELYLFGLSTLLRQEAFNKVDILHKHLPLV